MQRSMLEQFAAARGSAEGDNYVEVCSTGPVDSKNGGKKGWMCAKFLGTNQPVWVFPRIGGTPKWMVYVYDGKPY